MSSTTAFATPDGRHVVVEFVDVVEAWPSDLPKDWFTVSDEQRAFARGLAVADLAEELARDDADGCDRSQVCDLEPVTADDLVGSLTGPVHEMDLAVLASIAPCELETEEARLAYLQGLDRISARVAAMRAEILVSIAGPVATGDCLLETSVEHEVAVARRSSRYASGRETRSPVRSPRPSRGSRRR